MAKEKYVTIEQFEELLESHNRLLDIISECDLKITPDFDSLRIDNYNYDELNPNDGDIVEEKSRTEENFDF